MRICFVVLFFFAFSLAAAQPGDPGGNPTVPITGIEWLLLGGSLFGVKKLVQNFKKRV